MSCCMMVVEDEFLIATDLVAMLERRGWQVMGPSPSVAKALSLLRTALPVAALLDVNLGKELVTPVADALHAAGIPFALASATIKPEDVGGAILGTAPILASLTASGMFSTWSTASFALEPVTASAHGDRWISVLSVNGKQLACNLTLQSVSRLKVCAPTHPNVWQMPPPEARFRKP